MSSEKRQHPRTPIKMQVKLTLKDGQSLVVDSWDISDGGLGVHLPNQTTIHWHVGMAMTGQVIGLPIPGPELPMTVVRITDDRIGLRLDSR